MQEFTVPMKICKRPAQDQASQNIMHGKGI